MDFPSGKYICCRNICFLLAYRMKDAWYHRYSSAEFVFFLWESLCWQKEIHCWTCGFVRRCVFLAHSSRTSRSRILLRPAHLPCRTSVSSPWKPQWNLPLFYCHHCRGCPLGCDRGLFCWYANTHRRMTDSPSIKDTTRSVLWHTMFRYFYWRYWHRSPFLHWWFPLYAGFLFLRSTNRRHWNQCSNRLSVRCSNSSGCVL